jgi:hypothetical protein
MFRTPTLRPYTHAQMSKSTLNALHQHLTPHLYPSPPSTRLVNHPEATRLFSACTIRPSRNKEGGYRHKWMRTEVAMKFREGAPKILGDSNRQTSGSKTPTSEWEGSVCVVVSGGYICAFVAFMLLRNRVDFIYQPPDLESSSDCCATSLRDPLEHTTFVPTFFSKFFSTCAKSWTLHRTPLLRLVSSNVCNRWCGRTRNAICVSNRACELSILDTGNRDKMRASFI